MEIPWEPLALPVGLIFGAIAKRRGPHWELEPQESEALGRSLAGVIAALPLPELQTPLGQALTALSMALGSVLGQRIVYEQVMGATGGVPAAPPRPAAAPPPAAPPQPEWQPAGPPPPAEHPDPLSLTVPGWGEG